MGFISSDHIKKSEVKQVDFLKSNAFSDFFHAQFSLNFLGKSLSLFN